MKKLSTLVGLAFFALLIVGCEGPQGPAGAAGADGADGADGTDGVNAAATCTDCHNRDIEIVARSEQYANSVHGTGVNHERASSTYSIAGFCAQCHSHNGFLDFQGTGSVASGGYENPSRIGCRTCHNVHSSYTQADWGLTYNSPVTLEWDAATADFGTVANLCINCHQSRAVSPVPVVDGTDVTFTSSRYGPHHGPQTQVVGGTGLFEFGNRTITGGPNTHGNTTSNAKVCAGCHMYAPFGAAAGGHTWMMEYDDHGTPADYTASCNDAACHDGSVSDFDHAGAHTCVENALTALGTYLENNPAAAPNGIKQVGEHLANAGTYTANLTAAWLNYLILDEDRSHGVHNPRYAKQILEDTFLEFSIATPAGCW
jgi:hypothetical protein